MKILLIVLAMAAVVGGAVFIYSRFFLNSTSPLSINSDKLITAKPTVPDFNEQVFDDPRFYSLTREQFLGFTDQYEGVALSDSLPLPLLDIKAENLGRGRSLIISWWLPDQINFSAVSLYRSTESAIAGDKIATIEVKSDAGGQKQTYQDTGLTNNQIYYYRFKQVAGNKQETDPELAVSAAPTDVVPPGPPSDIRVKATTDKTVEISWMNPADDDFSSVRVYRSAIRGVLGNIIYQDDQGQQSSQDKSRNFVIDNKIVENTPYYYTVTSVDNDGNESSTNILAVPYRSGDYNPFEPITF